MISNKNKEEKEYHGEIEYCNDCKEKFYLEKLEDEGYIDHISNDITVMTCPKCGFEQLI